MVQVGPLHTLDFGLAQEYFFSNSLLSPPSRRGVATPTPDRAAPGDWRAVAPALPACRHCRALPSRIRPRARDSAGPPSPLALAAPVLRGRGASSWLHRRRPAALPACLGRSGALPLLQCFTAPARRQTAAPNLQLHYSNSPSLQQSISKVCKIAN